jgi:WD40 repeat protein
MADFITGDAFKDDRISEKTYGLPITSNNYSISFTGNEETPEPMCNTVCFLKSEDLNPKCRNLLAVSNSYICYIVKKSKLRVIHTESSKMALLQGHEFQILDLKFSKADCRVLCSIDDRDDVAASLTARIIIWRLDYSEEVTSKILSQFSFGAAVVQPHPLIAEVWAVAKGSNVGVISGSLESGEMLKSYGELSLNATVTGNVTDLSFSSDGKVLVVTTTNGTTSNIVAFILPPVEFLTLGKGKLIPKSQLTNPATSDSEIYAITCLPCGFLTASKIISTSASNRSIQLKLLSADIGDSFLHPIQSITVTLPVHSDANFFKESPNDIKLAFKNTGENSVNLVVLCHRLSNVLVCFAVDPSRALTKRKQQPLCHATFFDLKWPVFSLDTTTIEGRNYYSDDEVEHLEVACYQVQDSKHAVHQYHFNCCSLYSPGYTDTQENVDRFVESLQISDKSLSSSSYDAEQKPITFAAVPPPVVVEVSSTKVTAESWDESEILYNTEETVVTVIEGPTEVLAPLPEILRTPAVQGKSIMNMISKLKAPVKQAPPAIEPIFFPMPTPVFVSPPAPILLPIPSTAPALARVSAYPTPVTPPAAHAVETSTSSDHPSKEAPGGVVRFMHGVLGTVGTLFTEAPPAIVTAQDAPVAKITKPIQDFEVVPEEEDGEDDWAEASAAVAVTSSTGPHTVVPSALVGREALDRALEISKNSRAAAPPPLSTAVDAGLHDKLNDLTRGILAVVAGVSEIKSTTSALSALSTNSEAAAVQREEQYRLQLDKATKAMKAEIVGEMRVLLEASTAKNQLEMQAFKMESTASAMAKSKETLLAITKAMKGLVEVEMKKTVEV